MSSAPLVAVSMGRGIWSQNGVPVPVHFLAKAYAHSISAVGIVLVLIPPTIKPDALRSVASAPDGLIEAVEVPAARFYSFADVMR